MTKPKIAVQLYGHLRTFEKCAPALKKHLLDKYDCDVFIHTWNKTEHTSRSWYKSEVRNNPLEVGEKVRRTIDKLYSPTGIKIDDSDMFADVEGHFGTHSDIQISLKGMKSMTYSLYQTNRLREKYQSEAGTKYDYVLSTRPDILLLQDLNFEEYEKEFEFYEKCSIHLMHTSEMHKRGDRFFNFPLVADCLFFARKDTMSTIASVYENFDKYYINFAKTFPHNVENPELAFFENIAQNAITPRQYQFCFAVKRKNDKDDIRLMPTKITSNKQMPYIQYIPKPILKFSVRAFKKLGRIGSFLEGQLK